MDVARRYKTLGFSVPPMIATRIEEVVRERQLTRSELFREMFRAWEKLDQQARLDPDSDEAILKLATEEKEKERLNPTTLEDDMRFFTALREDLQQRARERGLTVTEDGEIIETARV